MHENNSYFLSKFMFLRKNSVSEKIEAHLPTNPRNNKPLYSAISRSQSVLSNINTR